MADATLPPNLSHVLNDINNAMKNIQVTLVANGVIAAMGRPVSLEEISKLHLDIYWMMFPANGHGRYIEWEKTKTETLSKIRT